MIIIQAADGGIGVIDPLDFKRFGFRAVRGRPLKDSPAVRFEGEAAAWISQDALRSHSDLEALPEWRAGLAKMIAFARDHGWVDAEQERIRAHIEWVDPA